MELVKLLRELWRRRLLVGLVAILCAGVGLVVAVHASELPSRFQSRSYKVGIATARILVDTPRSQVVAVSQNGSDTLGTRASLLASLMTDGTLAASIADRAGLPPGQLAARSESGPAPPPGVADAGRDARELRTRVVKNGIGDQLPIIEVVAQAPDTRGATALATAAVAGLRAFLDSKAADEQVPEAGRLRVTPLGPAAVHEAERGPTPELAAIVAVSAFFAGCTLILLGGAFARGWRQAARLEQEGGSAAADPGGERVPEQLDDAEPTHEELDELEAAPVELSDPAELDEADDPAEPDDADAVPEEGVQEWEAHQGRAETVRRIQVVQRDPVRRRTTPPPVAVAVQQLFAVLAQAVRRTHAR
jgi:hypothetical protein